MSILILRIGKRYVLHIRLQFWKMSNTYHTQKSVFGLHSCSDNLLVTHPGSVQRLQNVLFPITPRKSYSAESYLSSTFLKKIQLREDEENKITDSYLKSRDCKELFTKDFTPNEYIDQPPRWPTECQVIDERVRHIPYKPCPLEPYYVPTGNEVQPKPVGEESGVIVYQYYPISAVNYYSRSSVGGSKYLLPTCPTPEIESLRFESRFESGNLAKAIKITANYYELYLRTDMYTNRHMQWFYFRITNMRKCSFYRFSIVNFTKVDSLYTEGMQPLMYSEKDAQLHSIGWRRCGSNISYFCNDTGPNGDGEVTDNPNKPTTEEDPEQIRYHTLTFTLEFPHDDDVVYLAHSYPYTYSDLQDYLLDIAAHPVKSTYTTLRLLCKTLAGNNVYYVTVTSPPSSETNSNKKKKAIVVTARVHPGETPSSWMMHGFLDFLTSDTGPAKELRDNFIFKLVPMLNPDGVIVGNNRCSLTGKDLNRQYRTVIRETYPSIWYTKLMIRRLVEECGVAMYCDLHAHSKKHNIFIFGCENKRAVDKKLFEQVFPLMLHKNASEKFSFENCKFRIQKCKEGTGRVVMWMMGIANSFTMEASFGGTTMGSRRETHFNTLDFEQMGKTFCQTLLDFYDEDPRKERLRMKIINRLLKEGSSADEPANIRLSDYSSDGGDTTSSSEDEADRPRMVAIPTSAPPPTPTKIKKCSIPKINVPKFHMKSPTRRPLDVCKANLVFSGYNRQNSSDESSLSDSELEMRKEKKPTRRKKKKTKKKSNKKRASINFLDSGMQLGRDYAVIDILPDMKFTTKLKKDAQHKFFIDQKRQNNHQRLVEVQTKLLALKNKLWFGIGDVDPHKPLSWGNNSSAKPQSRAQSRNEKRQSAKKPQKPKEDIKQPKRPKESLRRQTAVEFAPLVKGTAKLRKTKSLTDSTKKDTKLNRSNTYKMINLSHCEKEDVDVVSTKAKAKKNKKAAKVANKST